MTGQSWNRIPSIQPQQRLWLSSRSELAAVLSDQSGAALAYGNGRSYGDVCLTEGSQLMCRGLDRFIRFDRQNGVLCCEAGVTLAEVLALTAPQGWFLPSTPGTRYATVGGALANDVHGKNHHVEGSFGHHVRAFELVRSDGSRLECRPDQNEAFFAATIGGLGLTGLISWVELQLTPIRNEWMWAESVRFRNLDEFWELNAAAEANSPYAVAWIDCLSKGNSQGRGILLTADHAGMRTDLPVFREKTKRVPFDPPLSLVNRLSLTAFNALYYRQPTKPQGGLMHYVPYFYPLDAIGDWNRIYGRRGFYQYQCVIPPEASATAIAELLNAIARSGQGSFLAVLKTFGDRPAAGMLSFPRPGATLALDFPDKGERTLRLFAELDAIVTSAGGALYPAKDARMPASLFRSGFPQWERFSEYIDPAFSSQFWQRVTL